VTIRCFLECVIPSAPNGKLFLGDIGLGIPGDMLERTTICPPAEVDVDYNCPVCFQHSYGGSSTLVMCDLCDCGAHPVRKSRQLAICLGAWVPPDFVLFCPGLPWAP
jgi:hypothetical protein